MLNNESIMILNAIKGLGNASIKKLIKYFGSASEVLKASESSLIESKAIPQKTINNIIGFDKEQFLVNELKLMKQYHVELVSFYDENYPSLLKEIPDAPVIIYVMGKLPVDDLPSIAIVGSRKCSIYGMQMAEKFAHLLSERGVVIVSGLALGIDSYAHQGCLKANGTTIAVLGSGLANIYPLDNISLAKEVSKQGAVISEFPMQMPPVAYNFPRRNRIVSGLSNGLLVVEAAQRSGALITADCALEQGRDVYCIPGKIDQPQSLGSHDLIKQGAKLVCCVEDILEDCIVPKNPKNQDVLTALPDEQADIYGTLFNRPLHFDEVAKRIKLKPADVSTLLFELEKENKIKQLPGKYYVIKT